MDFVAITENEVILVDFKTDKVDQSEILIELYASQLQDYVKVLKQMYPDKEVKAYLYSLALKATIQVD
jgi:ATP-dependent helicase/nuclease subunit A